jgi:predicted RNase H-like nuclease (RuvC/YqgF family)
MRTKGKALGYHPCDPMDEYYENAVEEIAFCEGGSVPLERNRTSELAMECWNLRKTLMEQSSQSVKLKKEIKTLKNLVKSLQRTVTDCEAESLAKTKDIHAQKQQILQCDRKIHELTTASNILNSSYIRSKKLNVNLQRKLEEADRENQQLVEKL